MKIFKIIIDILLFINTILLYNIGFTGNLNHEILGITISILIIIHIALNFRWVKQITKNLKKVNRKTKIMYLVDILIMLMYLGAIICGILISNKIFKIKMGSNATIVILHLILGRLAFIVMFIHLGLHFDRMFAKIKNKNIMKVIYVIYIMIIVALIVYSLYTLTHSFQWSYIFGSGSW